MPQYWENTQLWMLYRLQGKRILIDRRGLNKRRFKKPITIGYRDVRQQRWLTEKLFLPKITFKAEFLSFWDKQQSVRFCFLNYEFPLSCIGHKRKNGPFSPKSSFKLGKNVSVSCFVIVKDKTKVPCCTNKNQDCDSHTGVRDGELMKLKGEMSTLPTSSSYRLLWEVVDLPG